MRPGVIGGANWGGGAFDPDTGMLYVKTTSNNAAILRLQPPDRSPNNPRADEVDADFINRPPGATFMDGLPLLKPPYGHLTALDLNRGEIAWRVPIGDTPALRSHPALKDVPLPAKLGAAGAPGAIVTAGGLVLVGGGDVGLNAVDAMTGETLWRHPFNARATATPMTYSVGGKQYVVIAIGQAETAAARRVRLALTHGARHGSTEHGDTETRRHGRPRKTRNNETRNASTLICFRGEDLLRGHGVASRRLRRRLIGSNGAPERAMHRAKACSSAPFDPIKRPKARPNAHAPCLCVSVALRCSHSSNRQISFTRPLLPLVGGAREHCVVERGLGREVERLVQPRAKMRFERGDCAATVARAVDAIRGKTAAKNTAARGHAVLQRRE